MALNRELVASIQLMQGALQAAQAEAGRRQAAVAELTQEILDMQALVAGAAGPTAQPAVRRPAPAGPADLAALTMAQLVQMSGQMAQDAERCGSCATVRSWAGLRLCNWLRAEAPDPHVPA